VDAVRVFAPGSISNLGPGFDCLGAAFTGRGDTVTARRSTVPGVRVTSVSDARIPTDASRNTSAIAAAAALCGVPGAGMDIAIEKGLPLAGGMGGSAASAVAGAVAADALFGLGLSRDALLAAALDAEAVVAGRHADNVAPSLIGGMVLVLGIDPPVVVARPVHADWRIVLVTPAYAVETARARAVLPAALPRADAIAQAANLAGLLAGLESGDASLVGRSMDDRVAEPYRLPLYPGYPEARAAGRAAGAAGVAVSGAGPTVMAVVRAGQEEAVGTAMKDAYARLSLDAAVHAASIDPQGARVVSA
jgi:homoserine kinase